MQPCLARTADHLETTWADLTWHAVEAHGRRRHARRARAPPPNAWRTGKNLQPRLVRAPATPRLASRRTTPDNQGHHTAGGDGLVSDTPAARWTLWQAGRSRKGDTPQPVRRVSSPPDQGQPRPLGRPSGRDRVRQAIVKAALAPAWAARLAAHSSGCRPGRCPLAALAAIPPTRSRTESRPWGLDAASSGGLDPLDQSPLLAQLPGCTATRPRWLKAGGGARGSLTPTDTGTPQGGVRSPLRAKVALEGMARRCDGLCRKLPKTGKFGLASP